MMPAAQIDVLPRPAESMWSVAPARGKALPASALRNLRTFPMWKWISCFGILIGKSPAVKNLPKVKNAVAAETWILDGNYYCTQNTKCPRTQVVVFLYTLSPAD